MSLNISSHLQNLARMTARYKNHPAEEDFPDLSKHNNIMAKCLSKEVRARKN